MVIYKNDQKKNTLDILVSYRHVSTASPTSKLDF